MATLLHMVLKAMAPEGMFLAAGHAPHELTLQGRLAMLRFLSLHHPR
tara:strand:+ start:244 stop:384 length:141 start_codon:yes stop_codon:yes gene_type:complete